ncbi:uncharacterized protein LOC105200627 isoform X2 [Solenopsis invicta]|uniref:uncharacterized protein LOC105200627 isoform X2 n=1 Tax=Solenopsis invicta TaxID=13686 RepID=UPI000E33E4AF|nr:uncharacterized protein LOC105200627 isoform X2 [Solenopsis invicta]
MMKISCRMESVKTISFSKDYIATPYDKCDKNISNFPCVHRRQDYKTKPRKNTKFTKTGTLDIIDRKSVRQNDAHLLQCPFCGWEDKKYNRLDITTRKAYEQIKPLDIAVPCPEYLANKSYEYKARQHQIADTKYQGKCSNIITCQSFPSRLLSYTGCPADILTTHTYYPQDTRSYINQQMTPREIVTAKSKFCTRETQLSNDQLFPERRRKEVETSSSIQHHDKGIQNTICVSKIETDVRKYYREVQQKPSILQEEAINTTEQCDKQIQNTVCVSLNDCQASPKSFSTREAKQIDANIVKCPANDVRNMIGIKLKTVEGSMPNFVLITTDGNYLPSIQRDLKKLTINKCQKDEDHDQKEMKEIRLDDKKFIKNEACVKETCSSDTMEIIKYNSVVTQALLECLEKVIQERTKICSVTSFLSKRDNVNSNSSEVTVCDQNPCKFANGNAFSRISSFSDVKLEIPSYLPCCLEKTEKDNAVATFTNTFLELMKHALVLNSKNVQECCVTKEDAIDTFIVLSQIKECADKILKICMLVDYSKKLLLNKFYSKTKSKSKYCSKRNSALNSTDCQTQDTKAVVDQFTAFCANSKNLEILYGPSTSKINRIDFSENGITHAETTMEKPFVEDKDITVCTENHDIGLNVSLSQLRDMGTQYTPKKLQDTSVVTDRSFEGKISVATQNREPILIRVIKSNNSVGILKLDKETCVRDAHILRMMSVDKCTENMYQKYTVRELLHPGISHVREREVNCIDYRASLLPDGIYKYDKRCKSLLPRNYDWTKANISNLGSSLNQRVSKIPLYAKSRKYTRRRTDLYEMSQSYV